MDTGIGMDEIMAETKSKDSADSREDRTEKSENSSIVG